MNARPAAKQARVGSLATAQSLHTFRRQLACLLLILPSRLPRLTCTPGAAPVTMLYLEAVIKPSQIILDTLQTQLHS